MVPHPAAEPCGTIFFLCERSDDSKKMENSIFLKGIGWNEKEGCNGVKSFLNTEFMNVLSLSDIINPTIFNIIRWVRLTDQASDGPSISLID